VTVLLWLFAVALAYPTSRELIRGVQGVSVFAGLLFTIGSAGLVGQAMSGLVLMYSRSFKVGDFIEAGGVQGTVVELGLLSTRLKNPQERVRLHAQQRGGWPGGDRLLRRGRARPAAVHLTPR